MTEEELLAAGWRTLDTVPRDRKPVKTVQHVIGLPMPAASLMSFDQDRQPYWEPEGWPSSTEPTHWRPAGDAWPMAVDVIAAWDRENEKSPGRPF